MASGRARCTRKLRSWVVEQVESGQFPGVCWDDEPAKTMFRIPWKHAGKQDFREDQDALFFKAWAIFKGKYKEGDTQGPAVWKTRLRCALNKSPEFEEVPERGHMDTAEPYKVYRLLPPGTLPGECPLARPPSRLRKKDGERSPLTGCGPAEAPQASALSLPLRSCCPASPSQFRPSLQTPCLPSFLRRCFSPAHNCTAQPGTQKSSKRHHSSVSPEIKEEEETMKSFALSPSCLQDPFRNQETRATGGAGHLDSGSSSSSRSPDPQEGADSTEAQENQMEHLLPRDPDYSLLLTFIYSGRVVDKRQVGSLDCRLVAEASSSESTIMQVTFPKPEPGEPSQRLLSQLEKGILVASNSRGLFAQRLCPIPISWNAPQTPPGPGPHLLPSNKCVELFKTACFCRDFDKYSQGLGPPPKSQVTLHFWEESPGPSHTLQNPITVQMEQAFTRHLLKETPEDQRAPLFLMQS